MSEHDQNHDPLDKAYARAEALLSDEAARAARRARLLAAVAAEAGPDVAVPRRSPWPGAVWLAAASVAVVALLLASQSHLFSRFAVQTPPPAEAPPAAASQPSPTAQAEPPAAASPAPERKPLSAPAARRETPAPAQAPPLPPPPPPVMAAERPQAFPASAPLAPPPIMPREVPPAPVAAPPPPPGETTLNLRNLGSGRTALPVDAPPPPPRTAPPPLLAAPPAAALALTPESRAALTPDAATRLRAAAAAGRTAEVEALLAQGAMVDAPDEAGNTALMDAILANHPDVAAALRRRGASLEVKSRAGQSARDMAAAVGDAKLNQALGLVGPPP